MPLPKESIVPGFAGKFMGIPPQYPGSIGTQTSIGQPAFPPIRGPIGAGIRLGALGSRVIGGVGSMIVGDLINPRSLADGTLDEARRLGMLKHLE
tara:strand:- start:3133 stop:3417 length:285 start_codon:yes stop_codon:yes gene_type:complete